MTETLGQRIRRLRKGQNLKTCIALSAKVGVSVYSVRNWERDASTPHQNNMLDLAKALGVTQRYLAFGVADNEFPQDLQPAVHYDPPRGLPNRLKELRAQRGLSLVKIAKQAGVSHRSLWRWEAGKRKPTGHCLGRLAAFYRVSEYFLLHGVERQEDRRFADLKAAVLRWTISKRPVADLQRLVSEA